MASKKKPTRQPKAHKRLAADDEMRGLLVQVARERLAKQEAKPGHAVEAAPSGSSVGVSLLVRLSTELDNICKIADCGAAFERDVVAGANHYISEHGFRVLHVGEETRVDDENRIRHSTAIVLGAD
jgi:hypothetical protein